MRNSDEFAREKKIKNNDFPKNEYKCGKNDQLKLLRTMINRLLMSDYKFSREASEAIQIEFNFGFIFNILRLNYIFYLIVPILIGERKNKNEPH